MLLSFLGTAQSQASHCCSFFGYVWRSPLLAGLGPAGGCIGQRLRSSISSITCGPLASFGPANDLLAESGGVMLSSKQHRYPCFTQGDYGFCSSNPGESANRWQSWQAVPHAGGTETGLLELARKETNQNGNAQPMAPSGNPVPAGAPLSF